MSYNLRNLANYIAAGTGALVLSAGIASAQTTQTAPAQPNATTQFLELLMQKQPDKFYSKDKKFKEIHAEGNDLEGNVLVYLVKVEVDIEDGIAVPKADKPFIIEFYLKSQQSQPDADSWLMRKNSSSPRAQYIGDVPIYNGVPDLLSNDKKAIESKEPGLERIVIANLTQEQKEGVSERWTAALAALREEIEKQIEQSLVLSQ